MENKYRNIYCGNVTREYVGKNILLSGWIDTIRNLGSLVFITLRDETGIVQLISKDVEKYIKLNRESTVTVTGKVIPRTDDMVNKNMKTGEIEVEIASLEVLGDVYNTLPFEVRTSKTSSEETRLKYRYLDLRNKEVHDNILFRTQVIDFIRYSMKDMNFTEIQTPILTASSPEGARDFIVPSRKFKGKFYALPQAPQIFKQLLMCSGFDKYFQIAPCFRDEDPRSDRLYGEFYQLDLEMSFATEEDVFKVGERVFYDTFKKFGNKEVSPRPFRRIPYKEAMELYGSDKPDLRIPFVIENITKVFDDNDSPVFKSNEVKAMKLNNSDKSNSWFKKLEEEYKELGMKTLGFIKIDEENNMTGSLSKIITDREKKDLTEKFSLAKDNILIIICGEKGEKFDKLCGNLRICLAKEHNLIDKTRFEFCIIVDFPMYEWSEEDQKYDFTHNPFSMPRGGIDALNNKNPDEIVACQYDFVCNGLEMASGGERNYSPVILKRAFEIAGYDEKVVESKFPSLYTAFQYGAPPHAGMAPGIDRILMLLKDEDNIREMVAFPISANGSDALMGCPNEVFEKQLRETHIKIRD
ncbi:MAG TPA: aspartate--tRNA ligase [Bacilli bacterium]|nr:aspartate--tRNA ligase [Bacilli bacterium]